MWMDPVVDQLFAQLFALVATCKGDWNWNVKSTYEEEQTNLPLSSFTATRNLKSKAFPINGRISQRLSEILRIALQKCRLLACELRRRRRYYSLQPHDMSRGL